MTRVAAVIVNYRTADLAIAAARSLAGERAALPGLEVWVVDGGSGDGSAGRIADALAAPEFAGWARPLPLAINGGFGWANNQAILTALRSNAPPDFVYLLNPDAVIEPGALVSLVETMAAHARTGAVGSRLLDQDGGDSGCAFREPTPAREFARAASTGALERLFGIAPLAIPDPSAQEVDWVTGASVLLRVAALEQVGLFDSGFFLYFEEVELMMRMRRAGWTVRHQPASRVRHVGGVATGIDYAAVESRRSRLPRYWYDSRRRFFALRGGRAGPLAAGFAWVAGDVIQSLRRVAGRSSGGPRPGRAIRDLLAFGLLPRTGDVLPAATRADEQPGQPPVWMERGRGG